MRDANSASVPKWPFFLGDAILLGLAGFIYYESQLPLGHWEMVACGVCAALGALLGVLPFILDYRALNKVIEAQGLGRVSEKIQKLEALAKQISSATDHWENVQLQAEKISVTAKETAERMAAEVRDFTDFMKKISESERATLRLEVEKLRRAETDWLQVLVHLLDHVFALHSGAVRSGQPRLVEQMTHFQNACRDAARRVGLMPFAAEAGEPFDGQRHKSAATEEPPAGAKVTEYLAPGYTLQGRLIRPALVRVDTDGQSKPATATSPAAAAEQNQLPLEAPDSAV